MVPTCKVNEDDVHEVVDCKPSRIQPPVAPILLRICITGRCTNGWLPATLMTPNPREAFLSKNTNRLWQKPLLHICTLNKKLAFSLALPPPIEVKDWEKPSDNCHWARDQLMLAIRQASLGRNSVHEIVKGKLWCPDFMTLPYRRIKKIC